LVTSAMRQSRSLRYVTLLPVGIGTGLNLAKDAHRIGQSRGAFGDLSGRGLAQHDRGWAASSECCRNAHKEKAKGNKGSHSVLPVTGSMPLPTKNL